MLETQWWQLALPEEWQAEQEEELIVIRDADGVGSLEITTLEKPEGQVGSQELTAMAASLEWPVGVARQIRVADFAGLYREVEEDALHVREWLLAADGLLLFITYCCELDDAGMDDSAVDEILETLQLHLDKPS